MDFFVCDSLDSLKSSSVTIQSTERGVDRAGLLVGHATNSTATRPMPASPVCSVGWFLLTPIVICSSKTHLSCRAGAPAPASQ